MSKFKHGLLWCMVILFTLSGCTDGLVITWKGERGKTAVAETAISAVLQTLAATGNASTPMQSENATLTVMETTPILPETIDPSSTPPLTGEITPTPGFTFTPEATQTFSSTAEIFNFDNNAREMIRNRMMDYGQIEEEQLSIAYWERITDRISLYGSARNILTLEYHGDDYTMYDGRYSMSPASFFDQVAYLMSQDYHFVTMHEAEGFVYGWLELPMRSVILTTDISDLHVNSMLSMVETFESLSLTFGYGPHMLAFIWTGAMNAGACADNTCWQTLNQANQSGFFTFGSHSTTHHDFGLISSEDGVWDLQESMRVMQDEMRINAYTLAWPFETCSPFPDSIANLGLTLAWGGSTKPLSQNYTAWMDSRPFCLPRMLPPNIEGISMRPPGMNFQDMLDSALSAY